MLFVCVMWVCGLGLFNLCLYSYKMGFYWLLNRGYCFLTVSGGLFVFNLWIDIGLLGANKSQ